MENTVSATVDNGQTLAIYLLCCHDYSWT